VTVIQVPLLRVGNVGCRHLIQTPVQHHHPRAAQHGQMFGDEPGLLPDDFGNFVHHARFAIAQRAQDVAPHRRTDGLNELLERHQRRIWLF